MVSAPLDWTTIVTSLLSITCMGPDVQCTSKLDDEVTLQLDPPMVTHTLEMSEENPEPEMAMSSPPFFEPRDGETENIENRD